MESLLDTDLYKLTMQQAVFHQFPLANVRFKFKCRNEGVVFSQAHVDEINKEIEHLCSLTFDEKELDYLSNS